MKALCLTGGFVVRCPWRTVLCLLLAVTFLYNPFFVAVRSQTLLSVSHLPSYRANVASSELLKFKSDVEIAVEFIFEQDSPSLVVSDSEPARVLSYGRPTDEVVSHQVFSSANIWFRPPPVA
ncbi:MAG TPA: hypothetical protein VFP96_05460 [Candidatus Acidoferrum sp.]|nr:hypothetical protein [Candidatus Acidoferrum sp.]